MNTEAPILKPFCCLDGVNASLKFRFFVWSGFTCIFIRIFVYALIQTFLPEKQRVVLNVNSVLEALMLFLKNRNWGEALAAVLPNRMQGSFGRKQQRILKKR